MCKYSRNITIVVIVILVLASDPDLTFEFVSLAVEEKAQVSGSIRPKFKSQP